MPRCPRLTLTADHRSVLGNDLENPIFINCKRARSQNRYAEVQGRNENAPA
jgi:hypothetical protein